MLCDKRRSVGILFGVSKAFSDTRHADTFGSYSPEPVRRSACFCTVGQYDCFYAVVIVGKIFEAVTYVVFSVKHVLRPYYSAEVISPRCLFFDLFTLVFVNGSRQ